MISIQALRRDAFAIPVIVFTAVGLGCLGGCDRAPHAEAKPLAASPQPASSGPGRDDRIELAVQERCAAQAERAFNKSVAQISGTALQNARKYYFDHYNATLGRCFVEIHFASKFGQQVELRNAYEYTVYGLIDVTAEPSRSVFCTLSPPAAKSEPCGSIADFNRFVDRYMERAPST